jgi:transcriptional enhancer factor
MASSSVESSPSQPPTRHSTLDSFKCSPLQNSRTQDVFQSIVKGRKSWKTLRGGEVVWPPDLEAALIEGAKSDL